MKNLKFNFVLIALFAIGLALTSCGNTSNDSAKTEQSAKQGKEYTSAYVCPMHCKGSGSDKVGTCPVCNMDYVVNKDHGHEGHDHGNHEGHDHDNHEGHNH